MCVQWATVLLPLFLLASAAQAQWAGETSATAAAPSPSSVSPAPIPPLIIERLRAGDAAGALELIRTALKSSPHDCRLLSLEGVALGSLHRQQDALASFRRALSICPASLPALEGAAQIEFAAGDPQTAKLLTRILAIRPDDATTHAMLATVLGRQGECGAALAHFEASRTLFPAQPALLLDYGSCLARTDKWSEAAAVFGELARAQPSNDVMRDLAVAQWKAGRPQEALATLEPLLGPGADEKALALGSIIAEDAGDTPRAVMLLRSAILLDPDKVENYLAFARLADAHHSFQVGIDMIDAGLTRLPDAAPLYVSRGVLRVQLSETAEAEADFARAHQLDPQLSLAMDAVGILETQKHENATSLELFRKQAALHPQDALLEYLLAEALSEQSGEDLTEAIAVAKKACALETGYQPALDLLANLYLRDNQPALAVRQAELALRQDANDSVALFVEVRAKRKLGDEAELPALVKRLEIAKQGELARTQELSRYRFSDKQ